MPRLFRDRSRSAATAPAAPAAPGLPPAPRHPAPAPRQPAPPPPAPAPPRAAAAASSAAADARTAIPAPAALFRRGPAPPQPRRRQRRPQQPLTELEAHCRTSHAADSRSLKVLAGNGSLAQWSAGITWRLCGRNASRMGGTKCQEELALKDHSCSHWKCHIYLLLAAQGSSRRFR